MAYSLPLSETARRQVVAAVVAFTTNTPLAPKRYERQLLAHYQAGTLTIEEVTDLLDAGPYHILYRSRATAPPTTADLQALLDRSRPYNADHGITGLLLYSDERYVQLLEGPKEAVQGLFWRIQQDERHTQVVTLSEGPGPQRWFSDWSMAFGEVSSPDLQQVCRAVETHQLPLLVIDDPHLQTLLHAFGLPAPDLG